MSGVPRVKPSWMITTRRWCLSLSIRRTVIIHTSDTTIVLHIMVLLNWKWGTLVLQATTQGWLLISHRLISNLTWCWKTINRLLTVQAYWSTWLPEHSTGCLEARCYVWSWNLGNLPKVKRSTGWRIVTKRWWQPKRQVRTMLCKISDLNSWRNNQNRLQV